MRTTATARFSSVLGSINWNTRCPPTSIQRRPFGKRRSDTTGRRTRQGQHGEHLGSFYVTVFDADQGNGGRESAAAGSCWSVCPARVSRVTGGDRGSRYF